MGDFTNWLPRLIKIATKDAEDADQLSIENAKLRAENAAYKKEEAEYDMPPDATIHQLRAENERLRGECERLEYRVRALIDGAQEAENEAIIERLEADAKERKNPTKSMSDAGLDEYQKLYPSDRARCERVWFAMEERKREDAAKRAAEPSEGKA